MMEGFSLPDNLTANEEISQDAAMIVQENQSIAQNQIENLDQFTKNVDRDALADIDNSQEIITNGQNLAAGVMIAEWMVAQQYLANPNKLPKELQKQIREAGRVGQIDPFAYAKSLLNSAGEVI